MREETFNVNDGSLMKESVMTDLFLRSSGTFSLWFCINSDSGKSSFQVNGKRMWDPAMRKRANFWNNGRNKTKSRDLHGMHHRIQDSGAENGLNATQMQDMWKQLREEYHVVCARQRKA